MKKFRVVIESNFIHLPGKRRLYGYYTAIEVIGVDARHAFKKIVPQLVKHINSKGIRLRSDGIFQTRYILDNAWEVDADNDTAQDFVGGSFAFFPIRPLRALYFVARYALIRTFKPHLVFICNP